MGNHSRFSLGLAPKCFGQQLLTTGYQERSCPSLSRPPPTTSLGVEVVEYDLHDETKPRSIHQRVPRCALPRTTALRAAAVRSAVSCSAPAPACAGGAHPTRPRAWRVLARHRRAQRVLAAR